MTENELGTVERGTRADLMLVAADPARNVHALRQIRLLIKGGAVIFPEGIYTAMRIEPFAGNRRCGSQA